MITPEILPNNSPGVTSTLPRPLEPYMARRAAEEGARSAGASVPEPGRERDGADVPVATANPGAPAPTSVPARDAAAAVTALEPPTRGPWSTAMRPSRRRDDAGSGPADDRRREEAGREGPETGARAARSRREGQGQAEDAARTPKRPRRRRPGRAKKIGARLRGPRRSRPRPTRSSRREP